MGGQWGGRITGIILRPRAAFETLRQRPTWIDTWLVILVIWAICGGWLLSTDVGQQALVDERVRVAEVLGADITDAEYAALQASPPWWVYFASGGRMLLFPVTTILVAVLVLTTGRMAGAAVTMSQAMSIVVHATVALMIGQVVGTPLHYVRESLTSPLNLSAILPLIEDGSLAARFFGTIDLFSMWWAGLLAIGLATLTGQRTSQYAWRLAAVFLAFAAITATATVAMGGA